MQEIPPQPLLNVGEIEQENDLYKHQQKHLGLPHGEAPLFVVGNLSQKEEGQDVQSEEDDGSQVNKEANDVDMVLTGPPDLLGEVHHEHEDSSVQQDVMQNLSEVSYFLVVFLASKKEDVGNDEVETSV